MGQQQRAEIGNLAWGLGSLCAPQSGGPSDRNTPLGIRS
jgi:hypothetical protein